MNCNVNIWYIGNPICSLCERVSWPQRGHETQVENQYLKRTFKICIETEAKNNKGKHDPRKRFMFPELFPWNLHTWLVWACRSLLQSELFVMREMWIGDVCLPFKLEIIISSSHGAWNNMMLTWGKTHGIYSLAQTMLSIIMPNTKLPEFAALKSGCTVDTEGTTIPRFNLFSPYTQRF